MRTEATPVLVTGGAGFLGSWLVRSLVGSGHPVRVLDDLSTGTAERLTGLAVPIVQADVRDEAAVRGAMEGAQVVFHLAGVTAGAARTATQLLRAQEINVGGAVSVLEAARALRPRRVVFAGSGAVYGRASAYVLHEEVTPAPLDPEGALHLAAESFARIYREAYQVPVVVLRLFQCYGPGERWRGEDIPLVPRLGMAALEGRSPTIAGDPRHTHDLVYVENAIAALLAAGGVQGLDGGTWNVASGEAVSYAQLWRHLTRVAGFRGDAPDARFVPAAWPEPGPVRVSLARASRDLGYAPAVLLHEGLQRTVDWLRREWNLGENGWFTPGALGSTSVTTGRAAGRDRGGAPSIGRGREGPPVPPPLASWWSKPRLADRAATRVPLPRAPGTPPPPPQPSRPVADEIEIDLDELVPSRSSVE